MKNKGIAMIVLALAVILFSSPPVQNNPIPIDMYFVCECDLKCPSCTDVDFYVHNMSFHKAYLPDSAPWQIWDETQTTLIFAPVALQIIIPLPPSERFEFSWDQKDNNSNPIPIGTYLCKFRYYEDDMQTVHTLIVKFKIIQCTPVHSGWGIFALVVILFGGGAFLVRRMSMVSAKPG